MIINAENLILGRFATFAAKKSLMGEKVDIINCEKAVISGDKYRLFRDYKNRRDRGTYKGPFLPRLPDRFVRRAIRGMLPYKQDKGKTAFGNIKCHVGVPQNLKDSKSEVLENAQLKNLKNDKFIYVKELCKNLGAKI